MLGSCMTFVVALALIGVGASVVRVARPVSGYLMLAAGLLKLLSACCVGVMTSVPGRTALLDGGVNPQVSTVVRMSGAILADLVVGLLLIVSIATLAGAVRAAKAP